MIYLMNADRGSFDSVAALVDAGRVEHLLCETFPAFQKHSEDLIDKVKFDDKGKVVPHDDLVILDTLTRMADTTRGDMKIGTDAKGLWDKRAIYYKGDTYNYGAYEGAGQLIMRYLRNLSNRGYRVVVICHEDEQKDEIEGIDKRAPDLNKALWSSLKGTSTDIFRLTVLDHDEIDEEGAVRFPAGTRLLQTTKDSTAICKYSAYTDLEGTFRVIPKYITNPTMRKVSRVLGKQPGFLTLYGDPGAGKTTLACSEAFTPKAKTKKEASQE